LSKFWAAMGRRSPWVLVFDCGGCNGCALEAATCFSPVNDLERFGMVSTGNPKQADILLLMGTLNERNARVLEATYQQMAHPKAVVAMGVCACSGGVFADCPQVLEGVDGVVPVDVFIPGCSPRPEAVIAGLLEAANKLEEKS